MKTLLFLAALALLSGCSTLSDYQSHVAARTISAQGQYDKTTGGVAGGFSDRVEYR